MIFPEHTDALSGPADATINFRLGSACRVAVQLRARRHPPRPRPVPRPRRDRPRRAWAWSCGPTTPTSTASWRSSSSPRTSRRTRRPAGGSPRRPASPGSSTTRASSPSTRPGALPDGRSYFAMPFVRGRTLAAGPGRPARPAGTTWTGWLGVFERVCAAVAHAHGRGIVHRDLKPANVMVGPDRAGGGDGLGGGRRPQAAPARRRRRRLLGVRDAGLHAAGAGPRACPTPTRGRTCSASAASCARS